MKLWKHAHPVQPLGSINEKEKMKSVKTQELQTTGILKKDEGEEKEHKTWAWDTSRFMHEHGNMSRGYWMFVHSLQTSQDTAKTTPPNSPDSTYNAALSSCMVENHQWGRRDRAGNVAHCRQSSSSIKWKNAVLSWCLDQGLLYYYNMHTCLGSIPTTIWKSLCIPGNPAEGRLVTVDQKFIIFLSYLVF